MKKSRSILGLSLTAFTFAVTLTTPAYAYLDPGTASIVLQSIIAAVAAGAATVGIYWERVKGLFGFNAKQREDKDQK